MQRKRRRLDPQPLPPWGSAVCTGPDFRKRKKSRNQIASPNWNRMQRCGIGGEGETGAFKCLTPSTLKPRPPTRGLSLRAARHTTAAGSAKFNFRWKRRPTVASNLSNLSGQLEEIASECAAHHPPRDAHSRSTHLRRKSELPCKWFELSACLY